MHIEACISRSLIDPNEFDKQRQIDMLLSMAYSASLRQILNSNKDDYFSWSRRFKSCRPYVPQSSVSALHILGNYTDFGGTVKVNEDLYFQWLVMASDHLHAADRLGLALRPHRAPANGVRLRWLSSDSTLQSWVAQILKFANSYVMRYQLHIPTG